MTMPNFLILGAAKSGTSALYNYLRQHPEIFVSPVKEPMFFALEGQSPRLAGPGDSISKRVYVTDLRRYQSLFRDVEGKFAVGEASNMYLYSPQAAERIRHHVPRAKLIAMLRNPVDRAYSGYRYLVRDGRETLPTFEQALQEEDARIAAGWDFIWHHKRLGFYYGQLKRYLDLFDRDQIAVYTYDEFQADPAAVVRDIFRFLGVDATFVPDMSVKYNVSGTPRSRLLHKALARPNAAKDLLKPFIPVEVRRRLRVAVMQRNIVASGPRLAAETRRELVQLYRDDILKLQSLLGRDLSAWLQA